MKAWAPAVLSVLRIVAGFTFTLHSFQKLFGAFGGLGGKGAAVPFLSLPWAAGLIELLGLLILAGLFTRPAAVLLSGEMAVAYFKQHAPRGFFPLVNGGELAVLYCFVFLYLAVAGPGPLSLDRVLRRKSV